MPEMNTIVEDALRCAVDVSQKRGMEFSEQESSRLLESLTQNISNPLLSLAVIGEFTSGKSSLLNTLIGRDLLPVGLAETTATWFQIVSVGAEEPESLTLPDGSVRPISDVGILNKSEYEKVKIKVAMPNFAGRIEFFDTPGLSAVYSKHREIAAEALAHADAILLVVDGTQGITKTALEFLTLTDHLKLSCYLVINKADLLVEKDRESVLKANLATCTNAGLTIAGGVLVSTNAKPGIRALREMLISELLPKATSVRLEASRLRAVRLCGSLLTGLTTYRRTLEFDGTEFDKELHRIRSDRHKTIADIEKKADELTTKARTRVRQALNSFSSKTVNMPSEHAATVLASGNPGVFRDAIDKVWAEESRGLSEELSRLIEGLQSDFDETMGELKIPQAPPFLSTVDTIAKLIIVVIPHPTTEVVVFALAELLKVILKPNESQIRNLLYDQLQKHISQLKNNLDVTIDKIAADIKRYINDQALPGIREKEALMQNLEDKKKAGALNVAREKESIEADISRLEGIIRGLQGSIV